MRHLKTVRRLNRNRSHRRALLRNLANSLFYHESIKTTNPKAMELRKVADRLITLAKRKDTHAMRLAFAFLRDKDVVKKLFTDIGDRYGAINGGYTRVLKIGRRKGDAAPMAIIELTQKREKEKEKEKKVKTPKAPKKPKVAKKTKVAKETKETKETKKAKKEKEAKAPKEPKEKKEKKVKKEK